jgi:hypothetical protein
LLGSFTAAVTLAAVAWREQAGDPMAAFHRMTRRDPTALYWAAALAAAIALDLEGRTRREIDLVSRGRAADGTIDDVEPIAWRSDRHRARYRFITATGRPATGECVVTDAAAMSLQPGSRVTIYFDPRRPDRNLLHDGLRFVVVSANG